MSLKKMFESLVGDFQRAKERAEQEAIETRNFNPITGPISVLGIAERTVQETRSNGRGYIPDLVMAGIDLARDVMNNYGDEEEEEEEDEDEDEDEIEVEVEDNEEMRVVQIER